MHWTRITQLKPFMFFSVLGLILFSPNKLHGAAKSWIGTTTAWNTPGNWNPAGVPGTGDDVTIPSGSTAYPELITAANTNIRNLTINSGGSLTITSDGNTDGSLTATGNLVNNGILFIASGTLGAQGMSGTGDLYISGGTVTFTNITTISGSTNNISSGSFTCNDYAPTGGTTSLSGGTFTVSHDYKQTGGSFKMNGGLFKIGHDWKPNSPSIFVPTGGTVQFTATAGNGAFAPSGTYEFFNVIVDANHPHFQGNIRIYRTLTLNAKIDLPTTINIIADRLFYSGVTQPDGSYGSTTSSASTKNNTFFSGSGILNANSSLAISLFSFSGFEKSSKALLNWTSSGQSNYKNFIIERSQDLIHFETIGELKVDKNSSGVQHYQYLDLKPYIGINYYRLKQDLTGNIEYSNIISINITNKDNSVNLFPNPALDFITLVLNSEYTGQVTSTFYDLNGRSVLKHSFKTTGNSALQDINLSVLSPGIYIIKTSAGQMNWQSRIVVK